ncbi:hypothetical protein BpHYR1_053152 [Brachionus plicatilis]|uniref:Uncharacterized protein n=1 Tax=Brachionus plicatilis TaxID=10195 RepID=A0A3M7QBN8_BRAPC|nr:hypothetical protein BpHYR1_053152 [Brachionus plicatilis]
MNMCYQNQNFGVHYYSYFTIILFYNLKKKQCYQNISYFNSNKYLKSHLTEYLALIYPDRSIIYLEAKVQDKFHITFFKHHLIFSTFIIVFKS